MSEIVVALTDSQLERLADLLADRLRSPTSSGVLVTAGELAVRLGVDVKSVYRHADELGAIRVGRRVQFDPERALAAWSDASGSRYASERSQPAESRTEPGKLGHRRKTSSAGHCQLLPVGRRKTARNGAEQ